MEFIEGESLAQRLEKGALPPDQTLRYATQIAAALDKAHRAGIVHRDLKPGNIMLTKAGAKLLDFGLAKLVGMRKADFGMRNEEAETLLQAEPNNPQSAGRNGGDQPLYDWLWGSGFLPSQYQGVKFHNGADPVLYLSNPPGISNAARRQFLDNLAELNQLNAKEYGDLDITARIAQYEMAYRMQSSVPELTDLSKEPVKTFERYGPDAKKPGTFAFNCILARRLAERGVRFIQLFHRGWDHHGALPKNITKVAPDVDQPSMALIQDLPERGRLDDTLVIWGGEFGRTVYSQGRLTADDDGRDHHPRCFTIWLAGGGIKPGLTMGETDDFSYNIVCDPVHVHDLNAIILHYLSGATDWLSERWALRDSDWVAATATLLMAGVYAWLRPQARKACGLMALLAAGWWLGFSVLALFLNLRMTPSHCYSPRCLRWRFGNIAATSCRSFRLMRSGARSCCFCRCCGSQSWPISRA
jgi:hypothetical protein